MHEESCDDKVQQVLAVSEEGVSMCWTERTCRNCKRRFEVYVNCDTWNAHGDVVGERLVHGCTNLETSSDLGPGLPR